MTYNKIQYGPKYLSFTDSKSYSIEQGKGQEKNTGLYNHEIEHSSCGVGFLTRKDGKKTHDMFKKANEALCSVPHRGGMSAEGIGDGAGITMDISEVYFSKITAKDLKPGKFGVGNFFMPNNTSYHVEAIQFIEETIAKYNMKTLKIRTVPVNNFILNEASRSSQLMIKQWVFAISSNLEQRKIEKKIYQALLDIEKRAFTDIKFEGLYPLSLSNKLQVLKGRLNSNELIPYFEDLKDKDHKIHTLYFHTRFSTNTDPHPSMAQPFRYMAHNGELNTDKKNRLSENAIYKSKNKIIYRPKGQSDSCRLDQTLHNRIIEDNLDIITAITSMMPPAWENDESLKSSVKDMFEYFSLYEEKNDGPAAVIFGDGNIVGARLDRLGLRPLRTIETENYIAAMSEAGQINFSEEKILSLGNIEAGGMIYYDHSKQKLYKTNEALELLAKQKNYSELLKKSRIMINNIPLSNDKNIFEDNYTGDLSVSGRYVAYFHNQESFKFLMDPMLDIGVEKVSAMGYGNAINVFSKNEGGVSKYFSQCFSQVTNPPLDSIRESDGMTLRLSLGSKKKVNHNNFPQITLNSPVLCFSDILRIKNQKATPVKSFDILFESKASSQLDSQNILIESIEKLCRDIKEFALKEGGIIIITDYNISSKKAAIPMILAISAINQSLIKAGLRFNVSIIVESGQISSPHHVACALGFGASAVYPFCVSIRAKERFNEGHEIAFAKFTKATEKSLMKTMGKVGLCTLESYSGGEFFEPNYLNTKDPVLNLYFPNLVSPVGGVGFDVIAKSAIDWHEKSKKVETEKDIPMLGLFKERTEGAGHSYGVTAVREFANLTEEKIDFASDKDTENIDDMRLLTLNRMSDSIGINEKGYVNTSFDKLNSNQIDNFKITDAYYLFIKNLKEERNIRPVTLRDVLAFPSNIGSCISSDDFKVELEKFCLHGNNNFSFQGLKVICKNSGSYNIFFSDKKDNNLERLDFLAKALIEVFNPDMVNLNINKEKNYIQTDALGDAARFLDDIITINKPIPISKVQPASEVTKCFASGAMSHGALVSVAHEAVAHGTNMVGAMSNCGEGGENISRYGTIRASRIKQFASGRFGVWVGYLADPMLEEIEIKIGQGAKPGEGGQLPAAKVSVEIAAARGGVPGVELVSPPPHHDTYSIEDLAQLIHDAKAARVRVVVKLVSSEGIGTIAVGVAKAGADVINIAGGTGGTGAAAVTSLKHTGRSAEIGIAEVHQALCANKIRQKVILRCSGAHQTGSDVVKSALLGADSFEFGTTAMMMLKCVMAKNCNIKCPAGLTTNAEMFDGDPRSLGQYFINVAQEVRKILAEIGIRSLKEARGKTNMLNLVKHKASVGQLYLQKMLKQVDQIKIDKPIYVEKNYNIDEKILRIFKEKILNKKEKVITLEKNLYLNNTNKSFGGQLSIDIERILNYEIKNNKIPAIENLSSGRKVLKRRSVIIKTSGSAGQSYAAFCNNGMLISHTGTCNDGVGKSACGGEIIINSPLKDSFKLKENVLVGNFALFGATGGRLFIEGQAGDRFAVRNSGATAVVEGVGDYCAEYMTNGAVLNLGACARGFCNGMSGGFVYQYNRDNKLLSYVSHDSVTVGYVSNKSDISKMHADAIYILLKLHVNATNSVKAKSILKNWEVEKNYFSYLTPKSFLQYQDYEQILDKKAKKDLIDELANFMVNFQVEKLKKAWKKGELILTGNVPGGKTEHRSEIYEVMNNWTVLNAAQNLALKKISGNKNFRDPEVIKITKNLILTEDFNLMNKLLKYSKQAIGHYSDKELAVMISNKRINDFKKTLILRNVLLMDSWGTYGWILYQQNKNRFAMKNIPNYEELFYQKTIESIVLSA